MAYYVKQNNASSLVVGTLSASATTLNVTSGEGANFPSSFPYLLTIWTGDNVGDDSGMEIVRCTDRTTDALTIVRAQESTGDVEHSAGEYVAMLTTAGLFNDATYGVEGSTASIYCSAESAYLPNTNPAALLEASGATVFGGYSTLDYDTTTDEHAVWRVPVPDYDGGNMTFTFYWFGAAITGNVAWTIESVGVANAEELVAAVVGDLADVTADTVAGTTLDLNVTTHSTYNPAGVAADDLMIIEITRDVSRDTMAGDAKLMSFLLEYERS